MKKSVELAKRLSEILSLLNQGKRIDLNQLAEHFGVSIRTLQRDIKERLEFLDWEEYGNRYYKLNLQKLGILTSQDIERFALFASVSELFPKVDRQFYQEKLTESVQVKGFEYEDIRHLDKEFKLIQRAIETHQFIDFSYTKAVRFNQNFTKLPRTVLLTKTAFGISSARITTSKKPSALRK